jgi:23S rRNA pseudouridine1911/1915/1917 synthase
MTTPLVLHERSGVVAIAKPAGLPTQAPPGIESVESWLRRRLYGDHAGGYLGVPHRLDRAVSGVVLLAATPRAARQLSRQFERREVGKEYAAIVETRAGAWVGPDPVEWHDLLEKVAAEPRARIAAAGAAAARAAVTRASLVGRLEQADGPPRLQLRLEPLTGRMHQLRLQAASRGWPIVGDLLYDAAADAAWAGPPSSAAREPPLALHAMRIRYRDPDDGREAVAEAPLPAYWPAGVRQ